MEKGDRFGIRNVRSLYRSGSLTTVVRESERYKLDLVGVQEVRWDKEGTGRAGDYNFLYGKGNENHQLQNEMGGACGAYGGGESCAQGFGGETGGKQTIGETQT
jgi:hypothetical protein